MTDIRASAIAVGLLMLGAMAAAAEPNMPAPPAVPSFRRIYVPLEELNARNWSDGYLPIDAREFARLLNNVQAAALGAPSAGAAHLEKVELKARLVGEDLLSGTASLRLVARSDHAPGVLVLEPCALAIGAASWRDAGAKPAVIGTGADGKLGVLVEGGELDFDWSLRGERTASGAVRFRLDLPACPIASLELVAPAGLEVSADSAVVSKAVVSPQSNRCTIQLGGRRQTTLRLAEESAREHRPLTLLRQSLEYTFSPWGVAVGAQMRLDVHGEPLRNIAVDLDPTLRLVSARLGEVEIPWSTAEDAETPITHVTLQLPEPLTGAGRVLQLSAMAPLVTKATWRLPCLRVGGMSWQEGDATLLMPSTFELEQLATDGCRQSKIAELPGRLGGKSIEIQSYRADATIDVFLSLEEDALRLDSGTMVDVGASGVVSRAALRLTPTRGQRHSAQLLVHAPWLIDGVDNLSDNRPIAWEIEESPTDATHLTLRLDAPYSAEKPARILVRGHRALPAEPAFEARALEMLSFEPFSPGTRLISVRAIDGSELRWTGVDDLNRRNAVDLSPQDAQLFVQPLSGLLFTEDSAFAESDVLLQRRRASFTADIRVDAVVQKKLLSETYTIQCVPERARVERLLIHFSHARDVPLEWSLAGGNSGLFSARRISPAEQAQVALPTGGEAWELSLNLSRTGPFELRAVRSVGFVAETPLSLASVGEATVQRGALSIRALGDAGLSIKNHRLTSIPSELLQADRYQTVRATYRYQPARDDLGAEPAVTIAPATAQQSESGAWAWSSRLESRFAADGIRAHRATFFLQTAGRQHVEVTLPEGASVQSAELDDQRLPLPAVNAETARRLVVELPAGRAFATLVIHFITMEPLPKLAAHDLAPFPVLGDIPIMARSWAVWLPPGYEVAGASDLVDLPQARGWFERLFGPLSRAATASAFNPFRADDWRQAFTESSQDESGQSCRQLAAALGEAAAYSVNGEELTWGQLLASCVENPSTAHLTLLIDEQGLRDLSLTPHARVEIPTATAPLERGTLLLRGAGLALAANGEIALLTSAAQLATFGRDLAPAAGSMGNAVLPSRLADAMRAAAERGDSARFPSVAVWRAAPESLMSPWKLAGKLGQPGDSYGWSRSTFVLSASESQGIQIVHRSTLSALAWATFLATVGLLLWKGRDRGSWPLAAIALSVAACLLVGPVWGKLTSAVLLAGLFCLALRLIRIPRLPARAPERSHSASRARSDSMQSVIVSLLVALIACLAASLHAAQPDPARAAQSAGKPAPTAASEPSKPTAASDSPAPQAKATAKATAGPAAASDEAAPLWRVFVPVDDKQIPVGDKYYLPEELFKQLYRQGAKVTGQPQGWMIARASYHGSLARDPMTKRLAVQQLHASYDLHVFQDGTTVGLPVARDALGSALLSARLDGRTIATNWNAAGDELMIGSLARDHYRLDLELQPPVQADATTAGFDLPIPPLANATLELALPVDAPAIELPAARGQTRVDKGRGMLVGQLGACNRLIVRWPLGIGMEAAPPNLEVDELIWVKVRPGTTVLDAKFKYRILAGRVRRIRLLADSRLRLLPATNKQAAVAAVHTIPGDPQRIELELSRDFSDEFAVDLSFLVTGASGVGNLRLPRLESSGARAVKHWLAVSVDPTLQAKIQAGEDSKTLEIPEFAAAWGAADVRPQAAYSISRGEPMWFLATQPNEPAVVADQTLAYSLGRSTTLVHCDAALNISGGFLFQLRLQGPSQLVVEQISLVEDGAQRVAHWSCHDDGQISVFLSAPVSGPQQLTLRARWNGAEDDRFTLPSLRIVGAETRKRQWLIYRQPAILATVRQSPQAVEIPFAEIKPREGFGSLLAAYHVDDPQAVFSIELVPNVASFRAVAVTSLAREADRWRADFDYQVTVAEGLVDSLQFEVPSHWAEPYRLEPAAKFKVVPIPGEQRRQLIVYPEKPIADRYELKISARLTSLTPGVPDIVPLRAYQVDRFVVLPQHLDLQQFAWDTLGLTRSQLPAEFATAGPPPPSSAVYQVAGEHFQATLTPVHRDSTTAQVSLADIQVVWQADGSCQGIAAFDLEPGGDGSCVLRLPPRFELLHASVEQLPALASPLEEHCWRLTLGPRQLPQRLEVIFAGQVTLSSSNVRLVAPQLSGLKVARTLWTVAGPPGWGQPVAERLPSAQTPAEVELRRLQSTAALLQLPAETVGEHLPEEIARWYRPWRDRYAESRAALDWKLASLPAVEAQGPIAAQASQLDQQMTTIDARLGSAALPARPATGAHAAVEQLATGRPQDVSTAFAVDGELHELQLRFPGAEPDRWGLRLLSAIVILPCGLSLAYALRHRPLPTFSAWSVLGAIGFAWWLWIAPSVIGLALMMVAAGLALRVNWQDTLRWRQSFQRRGR